MAYSINGKVYTDHSLMDEIIYNLKIIMKEIVLKNATTADNNETSTSIENADYFMAIKNGTMTLDIFPLTTTILKAFCTENSLTSYNDNNVNDFINDRTISCSIVTEDGEKDFLDWYNTTYSTSLTSYSSIPFTASMIETYCGYKDITYRSSDTELFLADTTTTLYVISIVGKANLLSFANDYYLNHYYEFNGYYRDLNGEPEYFSQADLLSAFNKSSLTYKNYTTLKNEGFTDVELSNLGLDITSSTATIAMSPYYIYLDPTDSRLTADDITTNFNFSSPIHLMSTSAINTLTTLGIIDELKAKYTGVHYSYLKHLGGKKIDYYTARKASDWDILYLPSVEYLVSSRFKELYKINKDIYMRRTYQEAYKFSSDYFDEMLMVVVLCQTFADMIVDIPEWFIRRDVFDLRTVQYFLESQGVKFFKEIPLKYQIKIVKGLNRLIRYKSTTKNINDILDLFAIDGATVYKYYLFKRYLYSTHDQQVIVTPDTTWKMDDEYDFDEIFFDLDYEYSDTLDEDAYDMDNDFPTGLVDSSSADITVHNFEFGDEDSTTADTTDDTKEKEESEEAQKIIIDEYGNVYDLVFLKVPINENYDSYIKDSKSYVDYDTVTENDPYWDGEDTHSYIKNQILKRDFGVEGTKYMSMAYKVNYQKSFYQACYFLGMIFSYSDKYSNTDSKSLFDIGLSIPTISQSGTFSLTNVFILLYCLSAIYDNKTLYINQTPYIVHTDDIPDYTNYQVYNGGYAYSGNEEPVVPPTPEPTVWTMDDEYDLGFEGTDSFTYDALTDYIDNGFEPIPSTTDEIEYHYYDFLEEDNSTTVTGARYYSNHPAIFGDSATDFWDEEGFDKGYYDSKLELNGYNADRVVRYDKNADGGKGRYSVVIHETHYEWMSWNHTELFIPAIGRIYGFNLNADLTTIAKEIATRHSALSFEKGYTLSDLGVNDFIIPDHQVTTVEELLKIYYTNTDCYNNLVKLIEDPISRDQRVTYQYVFDSLFTRDLDMNFYRLNSGAIASTYPDLLKDRDTALYKYYLSLLSETDTEVRTEQVRAVLNDIVGTLEYYLKGTNLEYIFQFVPIQSFDSLIRYVQMLIEFFKSWKVYFLDPTTEYDLKDFNKLDNQQFKGDMATEVKYTDWKQDAVDTRDSMSSITAVHELEDFYPTAGEESIDLYSHHIGAILDTNIDAGNASSENTSTGIDETSSFADILVMIRQNDINGGKAGIAESSPYVPYDAGTAAPRTDLYDLDGSGATNLVSSVTLDIDGTKALLDTSKDPEDNSFNIYHGEDHNGGVSSCLHPITRSVETEISDTQVVTSNIRVSSYDHNMVSIKDNGVYVDYNGIFRSEDTTNEDPKWTMEDTYDLGSEDTDTFEYANEDDPTGYNEDSTTADGTLIHKYEFMNEDRHDIDALETQINTETTANRATILKYYKETQRLSNPTIMNQTIADDYASLFAGADTCISEYKYSPILYYLRNYTDTNVAALRTTFTNENPFGWKSFTTT